MEKKGKKTELKRALGLGYTTIFGVGLILGAGVYALIIPAEQYAENALWLSVLFATLIAVLTAFSYAEFASMFPLAASTHTYIERTFPKYKSCFSYKPPFTKYNFHHLLSISKHFTK